MHKNQKIITIALWAVLVLVMVGVIAAGAWKQLHPAATPLPILFDTPAFALTNQDGKPVTQNDLHGHPWVAAFIFTQCADTCPMMSTQMSGLQKAIRDPKVKLVSFTVDPTRDTPQVLKQYAARFQAEPGRWEFLTGPIQTMNEVAYGMKISVKPADGTDPLLHATYFLLVDATGHVRGVYDTKDAAEKKTLERLAHDANQLAGE